MEHWNGTTYTPVESTFIYVEHFKGKEVTFEKKLPRKFQYFLIAYLNQY